MFKVSFYFLLAFTSGLQYKDPKYVMEILTNQRNRWSIIAANNFGIFRSSTLTQSTKRLPQAAQDKDTDQCLRFIANVIDSSDIWDGYCYYMPSETEYIYMQLIANNNEAEGALMFEGVATAVDNSNFMEAVLQGVCIEREPFLVIVEPVFKVLKEEDVKVLLLVAVTETSYTVVDGAFRNYKTALLSTSKLNSTILSFVLKQIQFSFFDQIPEVYEIKAPTVIKECILEENDTQELEKKESLVYKAILEANRYEVSTD